MDESHVLQTRDIIREIDKMSACIPKVLDKRRFERFSRPYFGLSMIGLAMLYVKYFKHSKSMKRSHFLATLHWLKTYPTWVCGAQIWHSVYTSERVYRDAISQGVSLLLNTLKEVRVVVFMQ